MLTRLCTWSAVVLGCVSCTLLNAPDELDLCVEHGDACDPLATCSVEGATFRCECPVGYRDVDGDGTLCRDRDECADGSERCDALASCHNKPGGYSCACPEGYTERDEGRRCDEIDECRTGAHLCDDAQECRNIEGPDYLCVCRAGFEPNADGSCRDIDECVEGTHDCVPPAQCTNRPGTYSCDCREGLTQLDAVSCEPTDVCAPERSDCGPGTRCVPEGSVSYRCDCLDGYDRITDSRCEDVDECAADPCSDNAVCMNQDGGFACRCPGYFDVTEDGLGCADQRLVRADAFGARGLMLPLADADGDLFLAGTFVQPIEACDKRLVPSGSSDVFVAKLDAERNCKWIYPFGYVGQDELLGAALDPAGNPVLTVSYLGVLDLRGRTVDSGGYRGRAVWKLDGDTGDAIWAQSFSNIDPDDVAFVSPYSALAVDAGGNVLWPARLLHGVLLDAPHQPSDVQSTWDAMLVKLNGDDGSVAWSQLFARPDGVMTLAVATAVDAAGDVAVAGVFGGEIEIDGQRLSGSRPRQGFVAKLGGTTGRALWRKSLDVDLAVDFGWTIRNNHLTAATTSRGDVILAGNYRDELRVGDPVMSAGEEDVFVVALDGESGELRWRQSRGGPGAELAGQVAVDRDDRITVTGAFGPEIDFGQGLLAAAGDGRDVFVASFDADGGVRWAQRFGGDGAEQNPGLAVTAAGQVFVSAAFTPPLSVNGMPLPDHGAESAFVLELRP